MNFSKILASTAIVLVASLVLIVHANHYPCRGYKCLPAPPAYLPAGPAPSYSRGPHGPYHSYAVRPAVYGGPHLYTYRGYARHPKPHPAPPAPVTVHLKAAAYSPYSHKPVIHAPLTLAIETEAHPAEPAYPPQAATECHGYNCPPSSYAAAAAAPAQASYAMHPVKAILLAPVVVPAAPVYHPVKQHQPAYPSKHQPAYPAKHQPAYPSKHQQANYQNDEPSAAAAAAALSAYEHHAALAGPLYYGEAIRPAAYGAGHYNQARETLKAHGSYKPAKSASSGPQAGGY